jgi:2Fe-2S ferredoxin
MNEVEICVEDTQGVRQTISVPTDMNLNLMEVLKASEYPIQGTCGGMALCATCHIEVLESGDLRPPNDQELDMLDSLPMITDNSRLACQLPIDARLEGLVIRLLNE